MKDISELSVTQVRIYPAGAIPHPNLKVAVRLKSLGDQFSFSSGGIDQGGGEFILEGGLFGAIVIERTEISDRRIGLKVLGTSIQATEFYERLIAAIMSIAGLEGAPSPKPVILVQETSCTARLECEALSLLSTSTRTLLQGKVLAACSDSNADAQISQLKLRVELSYREKSESLAAHKITLAGKQFVIEPKANAPFEDHKFFTSSPTDSDTHLQLVREFEKALSSR